MAKLKDLPTELLLLFASFLGPLDLRQLAIASSWVRPAAENALYQSPIIQDWYGSREQYRTAIPRLRAFARTLLDRTDLANKVHSLSMATAKHYDDSNQFVNLCSDEKAFQLLERIGLESMQWHARIEDWQARLRSGQGHAWAGLVLALLPRLTCLSIETLSSLGLQHLHPWDPARYAHNPLEKLFGFIAPFASPECFLPLNLSAIAGLRHLERLSLNGAELDMDWFQLPDLHSLVLGPHCARPDILKHCQYGTSKFPHQRLQHLSAEISTCLIADYCWHYHGELDACFLSSIAFPALESLKLNLVNTDFSHYQEDGWGYEKPETGVLYDVLTDAKSGRLEKLLDRLHGVEPLLLDLDIHFYNDEDASFIAFIAPAISMIMFQRLRVLRIPQELLLGQFYGTESQDHYPLPAYQLLPSSLCTLELFFPTICVSSWLGSLSDQVHLPNLRLVHLVCSRQRGHCLRVIGGAQELWSEDRSHSPLRFDIHTYLPDATGRETMNAWDEDCDPYVIHVIRFLDSLHEEPGA